MTGVTVEASLMSLEGGPEGVMVSTLCWTQSHGPNPRT